MLQYYIAIYCITLQYTVFPQERNYVKRKTGDGFNEGVVVIAVVVGIEGVVIVVIVITVIIAGDFYFYLFGSSSLNNVMQASLQCFIQQKFID